MTTQQTSNENNQKSPILESALRVLTGSWLNLLLIAVPISIVLTMLQVSDIWLFTLAAVAIIPLAGLIGHATEDLADRLGPAMGGLLNATFGNAIELIIAFFALREGLQEVVKASISGSIIGNLLLVLGASMFVGGWGRQKQRFDRTAAGASAAMLFLAVVALVMPAVFDLSVFGSLAATAPNVEQLSLLVAIVLAVIYIASLVFSLRTHKTLFVSTVRDPHESKRSLPASLTLLLVATGLAALEAEILVQAIEGATASLGMTEFFVGVVVVAIVGNAAEHSSAIMMAVKDHMNLAVNIATGSATQIALFVAPVLVIASFAMGSPMSLVFNAFEVAGIALSVLVLSMVSLDGESNWFEGLQLIAVYVVLAIVFFFVPGM